MHIITYFAPKGGVGRSASLIAAASALIHAGKRILVLDMTWMGDGPTQLQGWEDRMVEQMFGPEQISVERVTDIERLSFHLESATGRNTDFVLVDTPGRSNDLVHDALRRSTLILAPANGATEAALINDSIDKYRPTDVPAYALVNGAESRAYEQLIRACFTQMPTLRNALPRSDLFQNQITEGDLFLMGVRNHAHQEAQTAARRLGEELRTLCARSLRSHLPPNEYSVVEPLASGHPLAHLRALLKQDGRAEA